MTNIVPFDFKGNSIRVVEINGEPWFVGKDVGVALGYSNPQKALRDHCKRAQDVGGERNAHPSGLDPQTKIIPESDVYRLIVRSKKPEAEAFEIMIMEEILPTIRKTGGYGNVVAFDPEDPAQLRGLLVNYAERTQVAEARVIALEPKAEAFDLIDASEGSVTVRVAAKTLGVPERKFTKWLEVNGWAFRQSGKGKLQAYSERRKQGYLEHRLRTFTDGYGEDRSESQMLVTPHGVARLAQIFSKEGFAA